MAQRVALGALDLALRFLVFGGLFGGLAMVRDPSGASLGMDVVLPRLPVPSFVLPGVFLVTVMGLVLGVWLAVQGWMIGFAWPIRFVTAGNAAAIVGLALLPVMRRTFKAPTNVARTLSER